MGGPYGPYLQSRRRAHYDGALERLAAAGLLYECYCSRREIAQAASAPHGDDSDGPRYPGTCRDLTAEERARLRTRRRAALRFRTPPGPVRFHDLLQGEIVHDPATEVGDFVVRRRDGIAAYQLAVVVDDAAMEISHVLRGADLLASTARQILLYRAVGLTEPAWVHVPLLAGADGERLAKRHGAASLRELREAGVASARVIGWLAASCGLAVAGEQITAAQLVPRFSLDRLPRVTETDPTAPWPG